MQVGVVEMELLAADFLPLISIAAVVSLFA
jgi:hypothetical protein